MKKPGGTAGGKKPGVAAGGGVVKRADVSGDHEGEAPGKKRVLSFVDRVVIAIRALQMPGGASRAAIGKYVQKEWPDASDARQLKNAFKRGVGQGKLKQRGQRFVVAGDPEVEEPVLEPLGIEDVEVGDTRRVVEDGDEVSVKYVGTLVSGGTEFDRGVIEFTVGEGEVIKGWDQGVKGMGVGGRRVLVVPPRLGYGKRGSPPDIPGGAALRFDMTLIKIL